MGSRTRIGRLLETSGSVDILLYIRDHPGCKKSEIYQNVTRNAHTPERIGMMESEGLIRMDETPRSNVSLMYLTEKGDCLVDLLLEAESMLRTYRVRCRPRLCYRPLPMDGESATVPFEGFRKTAPQCPPCPDGFRMHDPTLDCVNYHGRTTQSVEN